MKSIGILIPSYNRYNLLCKCISSFLSKANSRCLIEHLILLDNTDPELELYKKWLDQRNIKYIIRPPLYNITQDYLNFGYKKLYHCDFIWSMNDECTMKTKNWNDILVEHMESFLINKPDRILYTGITEDIPFDHNIYGWCYPVTTRETVKILDGFYPKEIPHSGADTQLYYVFQRMKQNRILLLTDIMVHTEAQTSHASRHIGRTELQELELLSYTNKLNGAIN